MFGKFIFVCLLLISYSVQVKSGKGTIIKSSTVRGPPYYLLIEVVCVKSIVSNTEPHVPISISYHVNTEHV